MFYYELSKVLIDIDICVVHTWKSAYTRTIKQPVHAWHTYNVYSVILKKLSNILLKSYSVYRIIFLRVCSVFFQFYVWNKHIWV